MISGSNNTPGLHRVFIGIGCDDGTREKIEDLMKPLVREFPQVAWVPDINRHLTLAFLGNISSSRLEHVMDGFNDAYKQDSCFRYRLTALTRFPDPGGRIVALVGEADEQLSQVYQHTLLLLQANGLKPAWNEFKPHITLGRIRKAIPPMANIDQQVDLMLKVVNITLYQSVLTPSGSVYTALREARLG